MGDTRQELSIPSDERHVRVVRARLRGFCRDLSFSRKELEELELALHEACVNAIRHARPAGGATELSVRFLKERDGITIEVRDGGSGFDAATVDAPGPEDLRENGYGIFIIRRIVDRFETRRLENGFTVTMTKRFGGTSRRSLEVAGP
jgi:serine/threonine-protein kinase RsbW